jgi:hypothetical protein
VPDALDELAEREKPLPPSWSIRWPAAYLGGLSV